MTLLSLSDLNAKGIPFCGDHLRRLAKQNKFPAPLKLSTNRNAWLASEIEQWLEARAAERKSA